MNARAAKGLRQQREEEKQAGDLEKAGKAATKKQNRQEECLPVEQRRLQRREKQKERDETAKQTTIKRSVVYYAAETDFEPRRRNSDEFSNRTSRATTTAIFQVKSLSRQGASVYIMLNLSFGQFT